MAKTTTIVRPVFFTFNFLSFLPIFISKFFTLFTPYQSNRCLFSSTSTIRFYSGYQIHFFSRPIFSFVSSSILFQLLSKAILPSYTHTWRYIILDAIFVLWEVIYSTSSHFVFAVPPKRRALLNGNFASRFTSNSIYFLSFSLRKCITYFLVLYTGEGNLKKPFFQYLNSFPVKNPVMNTGNIWRKKNGKKKRRTK